MANIGTLSIFVCWFAFLFPDEPAVGSFVGYTSVGILGYMVVSIIVNLTIVTLEEKPVQS